MTQKTALNQAHRDGGGKMVDFAGWDMPLHYGSQKDEHHRVREDAGVFDVSHMTVIDFTGASARAFLRRLLANDVARLVPGKALYSCMLNDDGGVIDDLIVYFVGEEDGRTRYRIVINAATTEKDIAWIKRHLDADTKMRPRDDLCILAAQGPNARGKAIKAMTAAGVDTGPLEALKPFCAAAVGEWFVGRTGYTGEDGFEIMLPRDQAEPFRQSLVAAGVAPCGLGARDTLRLEAGMNLYGQDMDETTSPLESGLGWTVAWRPPERDFIGRAALQRQKDAGLKKRFVGVLLADRGVMRTGGKVYISQDGEHSGEGVLTSGGFSPTLNRSIGLARVPRAADGQTAADDCEVDVRGKRLRARIVKPPFVRNGKILIDL